MNNNASHLSKKVEAKHDFKNYINVMNELIINPISHCRHTIFDHKVLPSLLFHRKIVR
jgi:hypothetical protein